MSHKPSVGRIVHYVAYGSPILPDGTQKFKPEHRAAVITAVTYKCKVHDSNLGFVGCEDCACTPKVSICVFNPTGLFFHDDCQQDENVFPGGTWHWPEIV